MPRLLISLLFLIHSASGAGVRVLFNPANPDIGPFPSEALMVPDATQKTGRRMAMPLPDCTEQPATCAELTLINQFDGYSLFPRIRVRFSGPINPATLRDGIFFVTLDQLQQTEAGMTARGARTPINEVVYDPQTNSVFAYPDFPFDQTRQYAIVITGEVKDTKGDPVEPDPAFQPDQLVRSLVAPGRVIGGTVFTTMSATAYMESARRQLSQFAPSYLPQRIFNASDIAGINFHFQVKTSGDRFRTEPFPLPVSALTQYGVGRLAFGSYRSPQFRNEKQIIDAVPTAQEVPLPATTEELQFEVFLPSTPMPPGGYPVVIVGHGLGSHRLEVPTGMIFGFPKAGFAIIAINAVGHGYGPDGTVEITDTKGVTASLPFGGRGADLDGNGTIDSFEGSILLNPSNPVVIRDACRQTALDTSQLVRAIKSGLDLDGDGHIDLNPNQIGYVGVSFGSFCGALLHAVEPDIPSAVLNVGGGSAILASRYSTLLRVALTLYVGARSPELINTPAGLNENMPLRYEDVRVNNVPGAIELQNLLDRLAWIETPGAPYAFATHFKSTTLPGVPIKRTYLQFAVGDQTVPNPANMLLLRAANTWDTAFMYRADLTHLVTNPHTFMVTPTPDGALAVSIAAQTQAAAFLAGQDTPPDGKFFERPSLLLELPNF